MKSHTHKPLACLCLPNHVDWKSTPAGKCLQSIGKYPVWLQQSHSIVYNRTMCVKSNPGKDLLFVDQDMTFTEEDIKAVAHGEVTGGKYTRRDGTPCYEDDWIGAGFLFVSSGVFEKVPFPWFDNGWRSETEFESEDQYFCRKAIKAGFEINQVQCSTLKHHITEEGTIK